jgi:hypothetical protein
MARTSQLLTITVPRATYAQMKREAVRRRSTVSGLLRTAFDRLANESTDLYSDAELRQFFTRDRIPVSLQRDLDRLLAQKAKAA